jgi:hypothetical protein
MTVYIIGTSHLLPFRKHLRHADFQWYSANNSRYQEGDFAWSEGGLSHTSPAVTRDWEEHAGRRTIPIASGDVVVAFGFDDRFDRYGFLSGGADHVSSACRAQTVRDLVAASPALRLIALLKDKCPEARSIMVEPPLLSRSEQIKKFIDRMVLGKRLHELCQHHKAVADNFGAKYIVQSVDTLATEGEFIYTRDDYLANDGYHWGDNGVALLREELMPVLEDRTP